MIDDELRLRLETVILRWAAHDIGFEDFDAEVAAIRKLHDQRPDRDKGAGNVLNILERDFVGTLGLPGRRHFKFARRGVAYLRARIEEPTYKRVKAPATIAGIYAVASIIFLIYAIEKFGALGALVWPLSSSLILFSLMIPGLLRPDISPFHSKQEWLAHRDLADRAPAFVLATRKRSPWWRDGLMWLLLPLYILFVVPMWIIYGLVNFGALFLLFSINGPFVLFTSSTSKPTPRAV